jgi:antitoxin FitA
MANLIVRNVDDAIANALKIQASQHGISAEAEHRQILAQVRKNHFLRL